jgi:hypothetical protein
MVIFTTCHAPMTNTGSEATITRPTTPVSTTSRPFRTEIDIISPSILIKFRLSKKLKQVHERQTYLRACLLILFSLIKLIPPSENVELTIVYTK